MLSSILNRNRLTMLILMPIFECFFIRLKKNNRMMGLRLNFLTQSEKRYNRENEKHITNKLKLRYIEQKFFIN